LQFEALGDKAGIARTLNNIGGVHRLQGDYGEALEHYQKSLTLKEQLGDKAGIAATLTNIGIVHSKQGNYVQALEHYQKSLVLGEQLGDKAGIAATLTSIGVVHSKQGNYAQALEFYQKGLALAEAIGVSRTIFLCYQGIGSVHKAQRNTEKALVAYRNAITLIESMRGQIAGGEQEQQRFFEGKVAVYHAMVDLLIEQYRRVADTSPLEALTYAERAKARVLLDVLHSGKVNITKTMTETEREREQALNNELVSLNTQITRESQRSQPELTHLANLKANLQKARLDYEAFQTSLYAAHPELKVQRGETKSITLDEARALLPDAVGRAASATALLEFVVTEAKTYLFVLTPNVQGLRVKGSQQPSTLNPQPLASTLNPQPLTLKVYSLDIKRDELAKRVKEFREEVSDPNRPVDTARPLYDQLLKPAQAQLQGKTTLIIVPDGVLWDLPFQALQPREGRYLLEDFNLFYAPSLTVLREMARLRAKGSNAKGLGLRVKGSSAKNQPSTLNPQPSTLGALLAFGNPTLGQKAVERVQFVKRDANLKPLLEAEKEVKALAQLYGAGRSRVYVGANAQEERVKAEAGEYRVLHFATHGILNDVSPMYSHLLLAQSVGQRVNESMKNIDPLTHLPIDPLTQVEDGLLEAWELMKLDLQADLVVLSACQTARGRVGAGEGIIGLTWALFVAGCPTTVVSQWEVDSASTAQLMVEFHKRLKLAVSSEQSAVSRRARNPFPFTKAEALRQAALMLRRSRQYRHPFYWAGFVVVGDGR
jgi:CHAT domain-containing protein